MADKDYREILHTLSLGVRRVHLCPALTPRSLAPAECAPCATELGLLDEVREGRVNVDEALSKLRDLPFADLDYATVDHHRALRQGAPEVILGQGKTAEQIAGVAREFVRTGQNVLVTRTDPEQAAHLAKEIPQTRYASLARVAFIEVRLVTPLPYGPVPVIAVPTSAGYGVGVGGPAALAGMLTSCAAGVTVCNIDNGFGAAFAALRILQSAPRYRLEPQGAP